MVIEKFRKLARKKAKASGTSYQTELNAFGKEFGYESWGSFKRAIEAHPDGICVRSLLRDHVIRPRPMQYEVKRINPEVIERLKEISIKAAKLSELRLAKPIKRMSLLDVWCNEIDYNDAKEVERVAFLTSVLVIRDEDTYTDDAINVLSALIIIHMNDALNEGFKASIDGARNLIKDIQEKAASRRESGQNITTDPIHEELKARCHQLPGQKQVEEVTKLLEPVLQGPTLKRSRIMGKIEIALLKSAAQVKRTDSIEN